MKSYVAAHLKDMNRKTVLQLLTSAKEMSRAEISRQTGISTPTVLKIANYLLENDFVIEAGEGSSALGRKPQILRFNPDAFASIGVEIEGDFLRVGVVNLDGEVKGLVKISVTPDLDEIVTKSLVPLIESAIQGSGFARDRILGVGLGIPGVLDIDSYVIELAPLIGVHAARECRSLFESLGTKLNLPVFIENDVNAAAIGEFVARKLDAEDDLVYVSLGTGLGAGIILNGRLRRGKRNSAGEIGYTVHDKDFHTKKTSPGWMESRINLRALADRWGFSPAAGTAGMSAEALAGMIDFVASDLAVCIANFTMQLDAELVVVSGITTEVLGAPLIDAVERYMARLCLLETTVQTRMCKEAGVVGAASLVTEIRLDQMLSDEIFAPGRQR